MEQKMKKIEIIKPTVILQIGNKKIEMSNDELKTLYNQLHSYLHPNYFIPSTWTGTATLGSGFAVRNGDTTSADAPLTTLTSSKNITLTEVK